jgi:hypothetical protein
MRDSLEKRLRKYYKPERIEVTEAQRLEIVSRWGSKPKFNSRTQSFDIAIAVALLLADRDRRSYFVESSYYGWQISSDPVYCASGAVYVAESGWLLTAWVHKSYNKESQSDD